STGIRRGPKNCFNYEPGHYHNIEVDGKNFDASTAKKPRNKGWHPGWADTT
ncbi:10942_t:CDS:1, partial [Gigaspora rosea]